MAGDFVDDSRGLFLARAISNHLPHGEKGNKFATKTELRRSL
jgi:hypothetical protein